VRLLLQGGAVLFVAYFGDAYLLDLGAILPGNVVFKLGWMALPFTVFAGIGLINAFNMADGVDGVCGTLALVALVGLGTMAALGDNQNALILVVMLAAGVVGFLIYNVRVPGRKHAKAFLGDAGSYLLGLSVLYLTIRLSQGSDRAMAPVSALWFCMLPLFDTIGMILRRLRRGRSPFAPDREHIHHVFLLAKFTVMETWVGLTVVSLVGLGIGLIGSLTQVSELAMMVAFLGASLFYYWMIKRVWRVMRFLSRSINRRAVVKKDRRTNGDDRRHDSVVYYINGIPVERRSGVDRRHVSDDRRSAEGTAIENITEIAI
jgi:UDP-GlcNAc:undecaprenyl-phosphate GlcNAc-1-phosphate transferase